MEIVGKNYTTKKNGERVSTLQVLQPYEEYYNSADGSRGCVGMRTEAIYVGSYDISDLEIGMEIEIYYDKAVSTAKGTVQTVKKIIVL